MEYRKPRVGFIVAHSHNGLVDQLGRPFPVMGMAENALRALEARGAEVILYKGKHFVEGPVTSTQVENYDQELVIESQNRQRISEVTEQMHKANIDCLVMFIPTSIWANEYMQMVHTIGKPLLLWAGDRIEGCQGIGLWAMHGALDAVGFSPFKCIYGVPENEETIDKVWTFIDSCRVRAQLTQSVFGQFGSMALGMLASVLDDVDWIRQFGITSEHLESLSILQLVDKYSEQEVENIYKRIIEWTGSKHPLDKSFERECRVYLALRELIEQYQLDFAGLKGYFELTDHYCQGSLAISLLMAERFVIANATDPLGALTMYIMRLFESGAPLAQANVEQVDRRESVVRMAFDGILDFSAMERKHKEAIQDAPSFGNESSSLWLSSMAKTGITTFARLSKVRDNYVMLISRTESVKVEDFREQLGFPQCTAFALKLASSNAEKFIDNLRSQYGHVIWADIVDKLVTLCELLDIVPIVC